MITVTGYAVLTIQLLMKGRGSAWLCDGLSCRQQTTDIGSFMAGNAALGGDAAERCVAGKAIGGKGRMGRDQRARGQHRVGVDKGQGDDGDQRHRRLRQPV